MSKRLENGLLIPDQAIVLDHGTRVAMKSERAGQVNFAVWFVDMISYKNDGAVILQVTTDAGDEKGCGVILTRSMLQAMLSDIITRTPTREVTV